MNRFAHTVFRNSVIGLIAQATIKFLSFLLTVLIIRQLGPDEYGQYAAVLAFGGVFVFLSDLGLGTYTVRYVAHSRDLEDSTDQIERMFANVLGLRLLLAVVTACVIIGTAWLTNRPPIMLLGIALGTIGLIMYGAQGTAEAFLAGYERLDITAGAKVAHQLVFLVGAALALFLHSGYFGVIAANLLGIALMTSLCWQGARRIGLHLGRMDFRQWPTLLRASLPFGIIGLTLGLSYKFDTVLLNVYFGDRETGYYNAAYSLIFSAVMLSNVLNTALYPSLTRQATVAADQLAGIYERAVRYLLVASIPIAVGGWLLADQVIAFLFDASYGPAVPVLRWLCWVIPLMFMTEFLGYVILVDGRERRVARAVILSTLANVGLNLILVPRFGYLAAAVMTVVTESILLVQYLVLLRGWLLKMNWQTVLLRPLAAALTMGVVVYAARGFPLLLNVALGAVTYGVMLVLLQVIGRDEVRFLRGMYVRSGRGAEQPL